MSKKQNYKTNISNFSFYTYLILIAIFILIFSIAFLVNQFIEKRQLIGGIINDFENGNGGTITINDATLVFQRWSFSSYFIGIGTMVIFLIFILLGRSKIEYGYLFRTIWTLIFFASAIYMFFSPFPLWQQIVNFLITFLMGITTCYDLLRVNRKRENLKLEIRQQWTNKKNNRNVMEI